MANIPVECKYCGSKNLGVRSSQRIENTWKSLLFCRNCGHAVMETMTEIVNVKVAYYVDKPEALRFNKPFREYDPNQLEIPSEA